MENDNLFSTNTNEELNYKFHQFITGVIGFMGNLELKLQNLVPNIPVYMQNSGDLSYWLNTKFEKQDQKEIYQKVPRFIISLEDFQLQADQNTNQYNKITYQYNNEKFVVNGRRLSVESTFDCSFVCPNLVKLLEYYEVMLSLVSHDNCFTYEWLGNTYEGSFVFASTSTEKPSLDISSQTKTPVLKVSITLVLQLIIIRPSTIKKESDSYTKLQYDIVAKNETPPDFKDEIIYDKENSILERKAKRRTL